MLSHVSTHSCFQKIVAPALMFFSATGFLLYFDYLDEREYSHRVIRWLQNDQRSTDEAEIRTLLQKVNDCPRAKELWDAANNRGPISVHFASKFYVPSEGFWEPINRVIAIDRNIPPNERIQRFLFEAMKIHQKQEQTAIFDLAKRGEMAQGEFLRKMVEAEHYANRLPAAVTFCIDPDRVEPEKGFEEIWTNYLTDPLHEKHREALRHKWVDLAQNPFCKTHPDLEDCKTAPTENLKRLLHRHRP